MTSPTSFPWRVTAGPGFDALSNSNATTTPRQNSRHRWTPLNTLGSGMMNVDQLVTPPRTNIRVLLRQQHVGLGVRRPEIQTAVRSSHHETPPWTAAYQDRTRP